MAKKDDDRQKRRDEELDLLDDCAETREQIEPLLKDYEEWVTVWMDRLHRGCLSDRRREYFMTNLRRTRDRTIVLRKKLAALEGKDS